MALEWFKEAIIGVDRHKAYTADAREMSASVTSCIMSELENHMKDVEMELFHTEQEEKRRRLKVDYSWLASTPRLHHYQIPQMERLELEEMCSRILPEECTRVVAGFRQVVDRDPPPPVEEMPQMLRCVIRTIMESRAKPNDEAGRPAASSAGESMGEWISRHTRSSLASVGNRVWNLTGNNVRVEPFQEILNSSVASSGSWLSGMNSDHSEVIVTRKYSENNQSNTASHHNAPITSSPSLSVLSVNELV